MSFSVLPRFVSLKYYSLQVCNGATYVSVDVLDNKKEKGKMILVEGIFIDSPKSCSLFGFLRVFGRFRVLVIP